MGSKGCQSGSQKETQDDSNFENRESPDAAQDERSYIAIVDRSLISDQYIVGQQHNRGFLFLIQENWKSLTSEHVFTVRACTSE